jgi:hypothetical protein
MKKMVLVQSRQPQEDAIEFWVGRDEKGFWIARGADGREGGVFVSRDEAMKFVQTARLRGHGVAKSSSTPLNLWK